MVLITAFALYLAKPVHAKNNHNDFANWLGSFLKDQSSEELSKRVKSLGKTEGELQEVIQEAAELISTNSDDFSLPFESDAEKNVELLLITNWQKAQQSNGMSAAFLIDRTKAHSNLSKDGMVFNFITKAFSDSNFCNNLSIGLQIPTLYYSHLTAPLKSGIAIGAP